MFQIFRFVIYLDIWIVFLDYSGSSVFRFTCSGLANNTSGLEMNVTTLQDPLLYFLHFETVTDQVFWFGFGSDFGLRILCTCLLKIKRKCDYIKFSSKDYSVL